MCLQLGGEVRERFAFYDMISRYFDSLKMELKVKQCPWASGSKQMLVRSFKWGTVCIPRSSDRENMPNQSWRPKRHLLWATFLANWHSKLEVPRSNPDRGALWAPTIPLPLNQSWPKWSHLKIQLVFIGFLKIKDFQAFLSWLMHNVKLTLFYFIKWRSFPYFSALL